MKGNPTMCLFTNRTKPQQGGSMPFVLMIRSGFVRGCGYLCAMSLGAVWTSYAQLDPEPRQLLHLGVSQSLHNDGPQAHYLFYYWNKPNFPATNQVLRLVIAPTYLDSEYGLKNVLGDNTDLGIGVFGGGFANSYDEVRRGNYF